MKTIVVASKNPVKIQASLEGFRRMFPQEPFEASGVSAPSGVGDQPMSDEEALRGALNRLEHVAHAYPEAAYIASLESGVEERDGELFAFTWALVRSKDGRLGKGRTGTFFLPPKVSELIRQGMELGQADDVVFGKTNSKQENGAVGLLTGNVIDRTKYYTDAVILALIPFKNKELYETRQKGSFVIQ